MSDTPDFLTKLEAKKIEVQWEVAWGRAGFRLGFYGTLVVGLCGIFAWGFDSIGQFLLFLVLVPVLGLFFGGCLLFFCAALGIVVQALFRKTDAGGEKLSQELETLEDEDFGGDNEMLAGEK